MTGNLSHNRIVRFVAVGLFNTGLCYAVYAAFVFAGVGFAVANLIALVAGLVISFYLHGRFVFGSRELGRFPRFVAMWGALYMFNVGLIWMLVDYGLDEYSAGAISVVPVAALSYLLQRHVVFGRSARR